MRGPKLTERPPALETTEVSCMQMKGKGCGGRCRWFCVEPVAEILQESHLTLALLQSGIKVALNATKLLLYHNFCDATGWLRYE